MPTEARVYNASGDRTSDPATFSFWDPVLQKTFVLELDSTDPKIPISGTLASGPLQYTRNATTTLVTKDTTTPANSRPLPVELLAGDALSAIAVGVGAASSVTLRAFANLGVAGANVTTTNPVFITPGTGVQFDVISGSLATEATVGLMSTRVTNVNSSVQALLTDTQLRATAVPVSGTVAVTGVATETTLAGIRTRQDVVDHGASTTAQRIAAQVGFGGAAVSSSNPLPIFDPDILATGTIAAVSTSVTVSPVGDSTCVVQISGTFVATLQFEGSVDNTTFFAINALPIPIAAAVTSTTTVGLWRLQVGGLRFIRVRSSAYTSGTATVSLNASLGASNDRIQAFGLGVTDTLTLRTSTNMALNGVAALANYGTPTTGSQNVAAMLGVGATAVSATNPVPVSSGNGSAAVQIVSASQRPYFQDFAAASLTTAYTQVIASTPGIIQRFFASNNSDQAIFIATGAAASEVVQYIILPGENAQNVPLQIAAAIRIAIRTQAGTLLSGQFSLNFF